MDRTLTHDARTAYPSYSNARNATKSICAAENKMNYEIIWAPWRIGYVAGDEDTATAEPASADLLPGGDATCFLCQAAGRPVDRTDDRARLVVARSEHVVVVLNRYPYNNGHLLIAPQAHVGRLDEIDSRVHASCVETLSQFVSLYESLIRAEAFNIGLNLGKVAGAGLPGHLHWHLVPRWNGDHNFMASTAGARVIPQSLDALWQAIVGDVE
jgi:ATP adenylyltransferase